MESMARRERTALCNTALEVGSAAPTLCAGWTAQDLVGHLLVRERDPIGATGIAIAPLEFLTDRSMRTLRRQDFTTLVERLRGGPPVWSPARIGPVDRAMNTLEFLIHHEDLRRAQPGWEARDLPEHQQRTVFRSLRLGGRAAVRKAGVPLTVEAPGIGETVLRRPDRDGRGVRARGTPTELALFCFGRTAVAEVDLEGPDDLLAALVAARLGM